VSDQLLNVLKLCLLALLYLFFIRVLRAVWAELAPPRAVERPAGRAPRPARPTKPARRSRAAPTELRITEPDQLRGRSFPLTDELTVGRAAGCQVTLDDTFVSQLHARVFARDGKLFVEDLGSTNGTYLNHKKVSSPVPMQRGDHLQVGNTVMELA
jgi:pSer/pThr/pTyr-binding forkhead associated (FHA) protein